MLTEFTLGLDLGQSNDPTALSVLQHHYDNAERLSRYQVRHLQRYQLGTPYPEIVSDVREKLTQPPLAGRSTLVVDATGVGAALVDMFRAASLAPVAITIHGGDAVSRDDAERSFRVPKRDLAGILQVFLQASRLEVANRLPEAATLVRELLAFRVKISVSGHDSYEAWRESDHDDLVLSVALALWQAEKGGPPPSKVPPLNPLLMISGVRYDRRSGTPYPVDRRVRGSRPPSRRGYPF